MNTMANNDVSVEEYKPVVGFEGLYEVSNLGNVKSLSKKLKGSNMKLVKTRADYRRVSLRKGGNSYGRLVHRLVAESFIDNPDSKPTVNHIDGHPYNNKLENLEWATHSEQELHSFRVLGRVPHNKGDHKLFCKHGHEFIEKNIYVDPLGGRHCKVCHTDRQRRYRYDAVAANILLGKWNAYEELLLNESIKTNRRKEVELRARQLRKSYEALTAPTTNDTATDGGE